MKAQEVSDEIKQKIRERLLMILDDEIQNIFIATDTGQSDELPQDLRNVIDSLSNAAQDVSRNL
jgi:hypothetical protein